MCVCVSSRAGRTHLPMQSPNVGAMGVPPSSRASCPNASRQLRCSVQLSTAPMWTRHRAAPRPATRHVERRASRAAASERRSQRGVHADGQQGLGPRHQLVVARWSVALCGLDVDTYDKQYTASRAASVECPRLQPTTTQSGARDAAVTPAAKRISSRGAGRTS